MLTIKNKIETIKAPQKIKNREVVKLKSLKTATFLNKMSIIPNPNKTNKG